MKPLRVASLLVATASAVAAVAACSPPEPVKHVDEPAKPGPEAGPDAGAEQGGEAGQPEGALKQAERGVTEHMPQHFVDAHDLVDAVVAGDLEQAQGVAKKIAEHRPDKMPADWWPYVKDMRAAAHGVGNTDSLEVAGAAAANVVLACGRCHQDMGGGPEIPAVPAPEDPERCMLRHRWATERLWLGLAAPSDEAWKAGASLFVDRPECAQALPEGPSHPDVYEGMAKQLQKQAAEAAKADTLEHRARVYGEMLSTCGNCHTSGC